MACEVIAALVGVPAVLVTAAAAYAAGRAQARSAYAAGQAQAHSAYQGPIDSVRRQHQREAYAQLLAAVHEFEKAAFAAVCARPGEAGELFARVEAEEEKYWYADAVVSLEGPTQLLPSADRVRRDVGGALMRLHQFLFPREGATVDRDHATNALGELTDSVREFTATARSHLNGEG